MCLVHRGVGSNRLTLVVLVFLIRPHLSSKHHSSGTRIMAVFPFKKSNALFYFARFEVVILIFNWSSNTNFIISNVWNILPCFINVTLSNLDARTMRSPMLYVIKIQCNDAFIFELGKISTIRPNNNSISILPLSHSC